jgi:hypothetical protein
MFLWYYYPAISNKLGYCGPDFIVEPECSGPYLPATVPKDVERTFGTHAGTCDRPVYAQPCFSGRNPVLTVDRGYIRIDEVKNGDILHVGQDKFSRVYSFGHYSTMTKANYIQLHTSGLKGPLEISKDHMVFVTGHNAVPVSMVAVGDMLLLSDGSALEVSRNGTATRVGAYAPFTESGTIAVSSVLASSYISLQENSEALIFGLIKVVSIQWVAHAFLAPH